MGVSVRVRLLPHIYIIMIVWGEFTYGYENVEEKLRGANIYFGKFCSIAKDVKALLGDNHRTDWITTFPFGHIFQNVLNGYNGEGCPTTKGDIVVGNDVWICTGVKLMSGIKIGDGAVVGAYSVVTKDVPPYSIVTGNPARIKRKRFSDEDIEFLLDLKWWDKDVTEINEISPLLCSTNLEGLKERYKK